MAGHAPKLNFYGAAFALVDLEEELFKKAGH